MRLIRLKAHVAACALVMGFAARGWGAVASELPAEVGRSRLIANFDRNWRFLQADPGGAEKTDFDNSSWRSLNLPHDWSIEGPFSETNKTGGAGGYLPGGVGWYRKQFTLPSSYSGRQVSVEFDGVMANSEVWINGSSVGKRPYGYVSFAYDLTPYLNFDGKANVIAVRADNSKQPASRWYSGAGIYRHVRLVITRPTHIERWSTFVTTPEVSNGQATVRVQTVVTNGSNDACEIVVRVALVDAKGKSVATGETKAQPIAPGKSAEFSQDVVVENPQRWNPDQPVLYKAVAEVRSGKETVDQETVPFGIREFQFKADTGFWLNGKNFKLYGVCLHHDGSAFGAAVPTGVWERRLETLRQLGVNSIRTAHNPPAPEFLDLCDRMGFLVMDEFFDCWTIGKNPHDYHLYFNEWSKIDTRDTIRRDRNHPCIILYSVGNEIHDTPRAELAKGILRGLVDVCHENDPTRPVTQGLFRPNVSKDYDNGLADLLDVIGTNYRDAELLAAQRNKPERKIVGTEQRHERQTWLHLRDNPSHSGQFLWTGIDYLGEARRWPIVAAGSGLLDRTGTIRPLGYERQSWWSDKPMVFVVRRTGRSAETPDDPGFDPLDRRQMVFPDWTPRNLETHDENVEVYSNCSEVELFLNGKSFGSRLINTNASPRIWRLPFEPGVLKAVGKNNGKVGATYEIRTAGKPSRIVLAADRNRVAPVWDEVSTVSATVVDDNGVIVPSAADLISFKVSGPGVIAAVDSGDNSSHEPFQASQRKAFQGRCFAILKSTAENGRITLTASAPGLKTASINISAVAPPK
jgi:beta-galactosidase